MADGCADFDPATIGRSITSGGDADPVLASIGHGYSVAVHRDFRHNAFFTSLWQFLWGLGIAFTMWTTIAPAYLGHLRVSRTIISLVLAIPWLCMPLQIVSSVLFGGQRRRLCLMLSYMSSTVPWLVYTLVSLAYPHWLTPSGHVVCFVTVSITFAVGLASGIPLFFELVTDTTPLVRRGGLAGFRSAALGSAGLLAGIGARHVSRTWPAPTSFHINMAIGLTIWLVSCFVLLCVRDHVDPRRIHKQRTLRDITSQVRETSLDLWSDMNCRIYLFFHGLLGVTLLLSPMMIDAAARQLGATVPQQQMFTQVYLLSLIGPAWCVGRLADRFGYRLAAVLIASLITCGFTLALCTSWLPVWYAAYGMCGLAASLASTVLGNMCVEMFPRRDPSLLLSTSMTLLLPLVLTCGTLAARLGDRQSSYLFVFAMGATLAAISALGFLLLVTEPRVGRMYVIRMTEQR